MPRVTTGGTIGDVLKRAGQDLPRLAMTLADLQFRKQQQERQTGQDEELMRHRGVLEGQGEDRLDLEERRVGIGERGAAQAEEAQALKFAESRKRMLGSMGLGDPAKPPSNVAAVAAGLIAEGVRTGNQDLIDRGHAITKADSEAKRAPEKATEPISRGTLSTKVDNIAGGRQKDIISQANARHLSLDPDGGINSIGGLEQAAEMGSYFKPGTEVSPEQQVYLDMFQKYKQLEETPARQGIADSIQQGLLKPEIYGQPTQPAPGPTLESIQGRDVDPIIGWARENIEGWDALSPNTQQAIIAKRKQEIGQ